VHPKKAREVLQLLIRKLARLGRIMNLLHSPSRNQSLKVKKETLRRKGRNKVQRKPNQKPNLPRRANAILWNQSLRIKIPKVGNLRLPPKQNPSLSQPLSQKRKANVTLPHQNLTILLENPNLLNQNLNQKLLSKAPQARKVKGVLILKFI
jgi:hypothetical protein